MTTAIAEKLPKEAPTFQANPDAAFALYMEQGYHIEPNVFSPEECDHLIRIGQQLNANSDDSFRPLMMPHREHPDIMNAMKKPELVQIMNRLVGGTAVGLQTEFFFGKPGTKGFAAHQDNFFVQAPVGAFASAWIALVDTSPHNGGLIGYPGTHLEGAMPVREIQKWEDPNQDPNANNVETIVPSHYRPVNAIVPKGSVFFIHGHFVHASHQNVSDGFRYVLLCTYLRTGAYFRPGNYACRAETPVQ